VEGPLSLDPQQVTGIRYTVVTQVYEAAPEPLAATRMALHLVAAVVLVTFLLFSLLKDSPAMWSWLV
jgi:hypothetical protein